MPKPLINLITLTMIALCLVGCGSKEGVSAGTYRSQIYEPYQEAYQSFVHERVKMSQQIANYLGGGISAAETHDVMTEIKDHYSEIMKQYDAIETSGLVGEEKQDFKDGIGKLKKACVEGQRMADYVLSVLASDPPYPSDPAGLVAITDAMLRYENQGLNIMDGLDKSYGMS